MDMEEMRQSLDQAKSRCCILELESRVNEAAKNMQESQVSRYQEILSEIAGEGEEIKSLAQVRLCCCMLEVDRNAELAQTAREEHRAVRLLQILSEFTGEPATAGNGQAYAANLALKMFLQRDPPYPCLLYVAFKSIWCLANLVTLPFSQGLMQSARSGPHM